MTHGFCRTWANLALEASLNYLANFLPPAVRIYGISPASAGFRSDWPPLSTWENWSHPIEQIGQLACSAFVEGRNDKSRERIPAVSPGPRFAARFLSRNRTVDGFFRPHPFRRRQLAHVSQLRLQRRRRAIRVHFRLYGGLCVRPRLARGSDFRRHRSTPEAGVAALCRARLFVRVFHRLHRSDS